MNSEPKVELVIEEDDLNEAEAEFELERIELQSNYYYFFQEAWKELEPETDLILNWHIKYLCQIIQAETERIVRKEYKDKDYIVNIPPRSAKSKLFNVMWCPWAWSKWPWLKFINNSFEQGLSTNLCLDSRRLIESDWYQERWGHVFKLTTDMNTKCIWENEEILLANGQLEKIKNLKPGMEVQASDGFKVYTDKIVKVVNTGKNKVLRIKLRDGTELRVTKNHRLHSWDLWKFAGDLKTGDPLTILGESVKQFGENDFLLRKVNGDLEWSEIVEIEEMPAVQTYDIQTEKLNCFFVNGILSHNSWYDNDQRGMRRSSSTRGGITGTGADIIINDDPQDPKLADSETERETVKDHWGKTLYSRLNNQRIGVRVIVQQRLHEDDLTGHLMANNPEKFEHICIPAEESEDIRPKELLKNYIDGLFFPSHPSFSPISLEEAKLPTNLGAVGYSGQMMQAPSPPSGIIFKKHWFNYWKPRGMVLPSIKVKDENGKIIEKYAQDLPLKFEDKITSWDMAFKGTDGSDNVSGDVWAKRGADRYLLNNLMKKMDFTTTIKAVRLLKKNYPDTTAHIVEDKANGPAVISSLQREIPGMVAWPADVDKITRALPMAHQAESGNIWIPHPALAKWVDPWLDIFVKFPKGKIRDPVDSGAHAINYLSESRKRVLSSYNYNNAKHFGDFDINWKREFRNGSDIYVAMYMEPNLTTSLVCCLWNNLDGKLYIFDEVVSKDPRPTNILPRLQLKLEEHRKRVEGVRLEMKSFNWFANKEMFGIKGDKFKTAKDGAQIPFYDAGINIQPNLFFNKSGAITIANIMLAKQIMTVHNRCPETNRQILNWFIEKEKPSTIGVGLPMAICQVISILHTVGKVKKFLPKLKEYSPQKEKIRKDMQDADSRGKLSQYVSDQMKQFEKPKDPLKKIY